MTKIALNGRFEILAYHRVGQENSLDGLTISKNLFMEQMRYIRNNCRPMALRELVRLMIEKRSIPPRAVAVTFDDGYADTYRVALPILKKFKVPTTVFITTGFIDKKVASYQNAPMMTWGMVRKMQLAGVEIGAHTITHPRLTRCSLREVKRQMIGSRNRLGEKLRSPVQLFAYPYGGVRSFNKAVQSSARRAGFLAACTTLPGSNGFGTDLYALRRMSPLRDQIHHMVIQLDQATRKKLFPKDPEIQGVSKIAKQIWTTRYKGVRRRLSRKSPLHWQMDNPQDLKFR